MTQEKIPVNRTLVGIIALVCLIAGVVAWFYESENKMWAGGFIRSGLLMSAFWLALPPKGQEEAWANVTPGTLLGFVLALFMVVRYPRAAIPFIAVIAVVGIMLRPKRKKRPNTRRH